MYKRIVLIFSVMVCIVFLQSGFSMAGFFSKYKEVEVTNGEVVIAIASVNDGKAHYFIYQGQGHEVKFFIVKSADGKLRAAFDACDVCFLSKKGYTQEGDVMVCNNCGRKFHSNRINVVEGGCNPASLLRMTRGDNLVINEESIVGGAKYF